MSASEQDPSVAPAAPAIDHTALLGLINESARVFEQQLVMQNQIAFQQAVNQLRLAVVAKCAQVILSLEPRDESAAELINQCRALLELFESRLGAPKLAE
ncbi:hypothetical protein C7S18_01510 [Ahniella affigens]|uniref:Uncharacterized protein n=1 Tax=Ahniella affigens TaxID=2021234 RepID=A0A2P1PM95_9GAMM|nr:hypothetical protein [Ahniella affigens]AVP95952.1 hypothetical protein C7S18_01510 [Ahniella affigens]